ncbi:hypothetical protein F2P81_010153 [Scophthalmus maximus]|uniref:GRAM domain-containing protein n=1 Tax=Scophthalmus maximus TaxID=52904 RepID=A0A6A4SX38_SCOMX|nr:hypothetical protein F2P81_010153 [Scophthalmus maximus]
MHLCGGVLSFCFEVVYPLIQFVEGSCHCAKQRYTGKLLPKRLNMQRHEQKPAFLRSVVAFGWYQSDTRGGKGGCQVVLHLRWSPFLCVTCEFPALNLSSYVVQWDEPVITTHTVYNYGPNLLLTTRLSRKNSRYSRSPCHSGLLVGTLDVVLDSSARVAPYRILYQTPDSLVYWIIAHGTSRKEITEHWEWLEHNMLQTLSIFENENDITTFVKGKVQGIIAEYNKNHDVKEDDDTDKFKEASAKFGKMFGMPEEEKLVNYYSCSYWKGKVPRQGWLYLSINHLCFYSYLLGKEVKLVVRWADMTQLEKSATLLLPDAIKVNTRSNEHVFSVFLNISETFKLAEQLANIAMRQLLDNKGFEQDRSLPKLKKKSPKKVSALKRDLDARAKSERYRALFRLPKDEKLDGHTDCTLWTPFNKMHILGQMFVSTNYICFTSKEETLCSLIIPLREVTIVEKADSSNVLPSPLSISTKNRKTFLFANLKDRDFLVQRISDFLQQTTSKIYLESELTGSLSSSDDEVYSQQGSLLSSSPQNSVGSEGERTFNLNDSSVPTATQALMTMYRRRSPEEFNPKLAKEFMKEQAWKNHSAEYGQGVCMYRTEKTKELVLKGIPESMRGDLWLLFSGPR